MTNTTKRIGTGVIAVVAVVIIAIDHRFLTSRVSAEVVSADYAQGRDTPDPVDPPSRRRR